jgi:hypothetical protein
MSKKARDIIDGDKTSKESNWAKYIKSASIGIFNNGFHLSAMVTSNQQIL